MNGKNKTYESVALLNKIFKIWHDKKIIKRDFKKGDQDLLFTFQVFYRVKIGWPIYRYRAIRLQGDIREKPYVVTRQCLK
jgi:uncharacterized protein with WD repeat